MTGRERPVAWIDDGLLVMRPGDPGAPRGEIYRVDIRHRPAGVVEEHLPAGIARASW